MHLFSPLFLLLAASLVGVGFASLEANADEPVSALPREVAYNESLAVVGKRLFFDSRLSGDGSRTCATCHNPQSGGAESRPRSLKLDGEAGALNAPSVFNSRFNFRQSWNGRFGQLETMLDEHLRSASVMGADEARIDRLLRTDKGYQTLSEVGASRALAEFVRALTTPNARFDRWLRGELELTETESTGYRLFKSLGCVSCHNGVNIGGNSYQYLGAVHPLEPRSDGTDRYALTGDTFDHNRFRVPSLRNVALTAPYLHDGSAPNLQVLLHMHAWHNIGFSLEESEVEALSAFLTSLSGDQPAILEQP